MPQDTKYVALAEKYRYNYFKENKIYEVKDHGIIVTENFTGWRG